MNLELPDKSSALRGRYWVILSGHVREVAIERPRGQRTSFLREAIFSISAPHKDERRKMGRRVKWLSGVALIHAEVSTILRLGSAIGGLAYHDHE